MYKYEYVAIVLEMESVANHYVIYHAHKHTTCNHDLFCINVFMELAVLLLQHPIEVSQFLSDVTVFIGGISRG